MNKVAKKVYKKQLKYTIVETFKPFYTAKPNIKTHLGPKWTIWTSNNYLVKKLTTIRKEGFFKKQSQNIRSRLGNRR